MIPQAYAGNTPPVSAFVERRRMWQERQRNADPSNDLYAKYLAATFNNNLPAFPLDSPFNQVQHYKSIVYLGIQTLIDAMSGAKCQLERKVKGKAGRASPAARETDTEYVPFEGHPLCSVLRHPNDVDTFPMFLAQIILQYHLTGRVLIWGVPNRIGAPQRLFVVPTALCTPAYGLGSNQYPKGAWRIQQYYPSSGLMGILPGPLAGTSGALIDSREVYIMQNPHPTYRWAPTSGVQATQIGIDLLEMIDQSCWSVMHNGVKPSGVLDMPGAAKEVVESVQAEIDNKHVGPDNHGRIIVIGGGSPQRPAGTFSATMPSADTMTFSEQWERVAGFVLASVCGLDLGVVGLKPGGSYADRWAGMQDVRVRKYEPFLGRVGDTLTDGPVKDWGLAKKGIRAALTLPKMADPTIIEQQTGAGEASGSIDYNEARARRGLPPKPGGDVPTAIYVKQLEQQMGIDDASMQAKAQAAAGGGENEDDGLGQLIDAAVDGDSEGGGDTNSPTPAGQTAKPGGDVKRPTNKGGKGSLPSRPTNKAADDEDPYDIGVLVGDVEVAPKIVRGKDVRRSLLKVARRAWSR